MYIGLYDRFELSLLRRVVAARHGDVVDVGAHIGFYTLAAAKGVGPEGRVIAFEPNPVARAQLEFNIDLNRCRNVEVLAVAVGAREGEAILHVPQSEDTSWSSLSARSFEEGDPVPVRVVDLDSVVSARSLRPTFVKIDVEGFELDVIDGMAGVLAGARPVVLCEVSGDTAERAARAVAEFGYRPYRVGARRLHAGLGPLAGIFNVLLVPESVCETSAFALSK
jgi:FkbM family methyltransferase